MLGMEKKGRKPFLYVSIIGMFSALFMLSIEFSGLTTPSSGFALFWISVCIGSFSIGIGPVKNHIHVFFFSKEY